MYEPISYFAKDKIDARMVLFNVRRIHDDLRMNPCIRLFPRIASHQQHMMES